MVGELLASDDWKVTLTPRKHWGARVLRDDHRGYGGFVLEHQGRRIYHAGDSAYFDGFKEIGKRLPPEIALLPIGAYHPESFRHVHMGPDEAIKVFSDLAAPDGWCRCTTALSGFRSRIWMSRRAGCGRLLPSRGSSTKCGFLRRASPRCSKRPDGPEILRLRTA